MRKLTGTIMNFKHSLWVLMAAMITLSNTSLAVSTERTYDSTLDKTILGQDLDEDGVRDDIESFISYTYPGSPIIRDQMIRYSKALDALMLSKGMNEILKASSQMDATKYCAISKGYTIDEFIQHTRFVYEKQVNTSSRIIAAAKSERALSYASIPSNRTKPYSSYCED